MLSHVIFNGSGSFTHFIERISENCKYFDKIESKNAGKMGHKENKYLFLLLMVS